jgi:hypothetical protein
MGKLRTLAVTTAVLVAQILPQAAAAADLPTDIPSVRVNLQPDRWCRNRPPPMVRVKSATQVQEWCNPGNKDVLQVDIFVKKANGDAGDYEGSYREWPCSDVPHDRVHDTLC